MTASLTALRTAVGRLWHTDKPLTATGLLMLAALVASIAGLWLDPRVITGTPAWLKPAKFAVSLAIYTLTLAWVFSYLPEWRKTRRIVGWTSAVVFVLELVVIDVQAWRGTTSHFNIGSALDAALFSLMGAAIVVQTMSSIVVAVALWQQRFADAAMGWALRLGLTLTIVGAFTGGLMTQPTAAQLADARATGRMAVAGAHTVGAPDGGPGIPGTGWSREHGDIRVPHFVGLHAMQALPLVAWLIRRRHLPERTRVRSLFVASTSYTAVYGILLWQALHGQSILEPDAVTQAAFAAWAVLTISAVWRVAGRATRGTFTPAAC